MIPSPGPYLFEEPTQEIYERNRFRPAFQAGTDTNLLTRSLSSNLNLPALSLADYSYTVSMLDNNYNLPDPSLLMSEANKKHEDEKATSPAPSHRADYPLPGKDHSDSHHTGHIHNHNHNEINYVQHYSDMNNEGYRERNKRDSPGLKLVYDQLEHGHEHDRTDGRRKLSDSQLVLEKYYCMDDEVDDMSSVESDTDKSLLMRFQKSPLLRS